MRWEGRHIMGGGANPQACEGGANIFGGDENFLEVSKRGGEKKST